MKSPKQIKKPFSNHFTRLSIEASSCNDDEHESISSVSCETCDTGDTTPSCPSADPELRLSGDDLGDAIETIAIVQVSRHLDLVEKSSADSSKQIHELYQASQAVWRQTGAGGISLVVAAAVTNVACASLRELDVQLRELDPYIDLPSLHKTCGLPQGLSSIEYETGPKCEDQHQMLEDMHTSWKAVNHVKKGHSMPTGVACLHQPAELVNSPDFVTLLMQAILRLASGEAAADAVIRNGTPAYVEIAHSKDPSNKLWSTLVLHLLSDSYKAYMSGLRSPVMLSSCRLSALKLSQQAQSSLSAVLSDKVSFPCRCEETISFRLDQLRHTLQRYTAYKCWDIFFQAPWVAGNHILEMLDMCFYYGMRLIRYRHYVGSVLHSYNVLKQLAAMEETPLLEYLCNTFAHIFFPGGQRPINRFAASWARFVGARLKFKKGHKDHNHRESWCMAVPTHTAKRAAGFGIDGEGKSQVAEDTCISEIMDLKRRDYHVDESTWDIICGWEDLGAIKKAKKRPTASPRSTERKFVPNHSTTAHSNHLQDLSSYLDQDMKRTLPSLRLNLFAVFETCVKVVSSISNATHPGPRDKELRCICFATTILTGGDRIKDAEALGKPDCWKKSNGERKTVEDAQKAIREAMATVERADWLWNV